MAKDIEEKLEIRAFFESNDLSYAKTAEHFSTMGYDISKKTLEYWGRTDIPRWQKGRYKDIEEALEALMDESVMEAMDIKAKEIIKEKIKSGHKEALDAEVLDEDDLEAMSVAAQKALAYRILNKHTLTAKMAQNLERAEKFAKKAKTISVSATYHAMLTSTYATVHGKQTNLVLTDPSSGVKNEKELEAMSTEELKALIGEA